MNRTGLRSVAQASILLAVFALGPSSTVTFSNASSDDDSGTVRLLVKTRGPLTPETERAVAAHAARVSFVWREIDAMAVSVNPAKFSELLADPNVLLVEADAQGRSDANDGLIPVGLPSPPASFAPPGIGTTARDPWNLDMADTAGSGYDGHGVVVAVVDSGLPQNWPEFLPPGSVDLTLAAGFGGEGWGDPRAAQNGIHGVGGHIGLFPHGLAVSSVIVGFPSELGPIGGAAPGSTILPIRVLNQFNRGWYSWFTEAFLYLGRLKRDGALPGPVVVSFSIQGGSDSQILREAIDFLIARGIVFVTIAGNFGPDIGSVSFPGRLPQSITAGAAGWLRQFDEDQDSIFGDVRENDPAEVYVASFSGREEFLLGAPKRIDVLAPGSYVFGEWLFGPRFSEGRQVAYDPIDNFIFGTSFAAPHVAGIAAQMMEKNPSLRQAQVEAILEATALPIPPNPHGTIYSYGWGREATGFGLARGTLAVAATPSP